MKRLKLSIVALLTIMGVVAWLLPFSIVSYATDPVLYLQDLEQTEAKYILKACNEINNQVKNETSIDKFIKFGLVSGTNADYELTVVMSKYKNLSQEDKQTVMMIALDTVNNSSISFTNRNKIYNFIADNDTSVSSLVRQLSNDVDADFAAAYSSFKPFSGVIGWILGTFTLVIFIMLAITIVFDVAYITIPAWQLLVGSGNTKDKPKFTSLEAWKAVQSAEEDTSGTKTAMGLYLKTKTKQFIAIGICILYLVSGEIYHLIANIIDLFQGLLS